MAIKIIAPREIELRSGTLGNRHSLKNRHCSVIKLAYINHYYPQNLKHLEAIVM